MLLLKLLLIWLLSLIFNLGYLSVTKALEPQEADDDIIFFIFILSPIALILCVIHFILVILYPSLSKIIGTMIREIY